MKTSYGFSGLVAILILFLVSPASGIALYSTLTETLYMDCARNVDGGPAYRVDMEFHGGALRSRTAARLDSPQRQVFIAARIVEMPNTDLCQLGVDPMFRTAGDSIDVDIPQVDIVGNTGGMMGTAAVNLVSGPDLAFRMEGAQLLDPGAVTPESRHKLVISEIEPHVEHMPAQGFSLVGNCLSLTVTPSISPTAQIMVDMQVATTQGGPTPGNLLEINTIPAPIDGAAVRGGLTRINQYDRYDKIPLLGEIPALGYLFKVDTEQSARTELVIFVNANVVSCGD